MNFGKWECVQQLGKGSFGRVFRYKNTQTKLEIAVKLINNAEALSADQQRKLKERWKKECDWATNMQQTPYIVSGVKLGKDSDGFIAFLSKKNFEKLPAMIIEYCNGGDLRKVLQTPRNFNGLSEFEVREILLSLWKAIEFLHKICNICHRDLKPDNIVIHEANGRKQYKLTDFGLARIAPSHTIDQSIVGTQFYCAPEVVIDGKYNSTVDFWSLGVISYEIVTGVLPFIPHQIMYKIYQNLKEKQRNCIAITEDLHTENKFIYHTELPVDHHLSKPFAEECIELLRQTLDVNYKKRGATDEVQNPHKNIYTKIDRLATMKILTIYVVNRCKRLEYELTPSLTRKELNNCIERDAKLPKECIYYVLPPCHSLKQITDDTPPENFYMPEWCDTEKDPPVMVYVFNINNISECQAPDANIPEELQRFFDKNDKKLNDRIKMHLARGLHYALSSEEYNLRMRVHSFKDLALTNEDKIMNYEPVITALVKEKEKCFGAFEQIQMMIDAAISQQKINLNTYKEWLQNLERLTDKHSELQSCINKTLKHYESILRSAKEAVRMSKRIYDSTIDRDVYKLKEYRNKMVSDVRSLDLYDQAIDFARTRDIFLKNKDIMSLSDSLNQAHCRFTKITSTTQTAIRTINELREKLMQLQLQILARDMPMAMSMHQQKPPIFDLSDAARNHLSFDSLHTKNLIEEAMEIRERLEERMINISLERL